MRELLAAELWRSFGGLSISAIQEALIPLIQARLPAPAAERFQRGFFWMGRSASPEDLRRAESLFYRRRAEELLCLRAPISALHAWAERGADLHLGTERGPAVLLGAHTGAMIYSAPLIALASERPVLMISNTPVLDLNLKARLERFSPHLRLLIKSTGGELRAARYLLKALKAGEQVMLRMDLFSGGLNKHPLKFLGRFVELPGIWGAVKLARLADLPLIPLHSARRGERLFFELEPPLEPDEAAPQALADRLSAWILEDPCDWDLLPECTAF